MNIGWEEKCLWLAEHFHELSTDQQHTIIHDLEHDHAKLLDLWTIQDELLSSLKTVLCGGHPLSFSTPTPSSEGIGYYLLEMYDKSKRKLSEELSGTANKTRLLLYLGYACIYEEDDERAIDAFLTVYQQTDDDVEKHFSLVGLGLVQGRKEQIEEAIPFFERALTVKQNDDVVYNLGTCFYWLKKYEMAKEWFYRAVEASPDPEALYWLGKTYALCGDEQKAFELWYNVIEEPKDFDVVLTLACEFEERGEFLCALHCYNKLVEFGIETEAVIHGTAWNLGLMDRKKESYDLFVTLVNQYPKNVNGWISFLWLLTKWGWTSEQEWVLSYLKKEKVSHPLLEKILHSQLKM
ncbi:tetratricopeptide repeat protein [Alteribacter aurantiacus]|uniref:tetratricopeptide repeat protein n=1 Tax=Alteribacter aurantiacus TaxID=254410 RepID=UPI00041603E1|nr:tetratricopeptide repeat protein [Alteribacter aurantiacus]